MSRTSLPTLPTPEPSAAYEPEPSLELAEEQSSKLTWCVDLGTELRAMSTLDLWIALSRSEIATSTLVWRLGREAWTAASEVPELTCALRARDVDYPVIALHSIDVEESERIATLSFGLLDDEAERNDAPELPAALGGSPRVSLVDPSEISEIERAAREVSERAAAETPLGRGTFAPVASISPPAPPVSTPPSALSIAPAPQSPPRRIGLSRRARRPLVAALAAAAAWFFLSTPPREPAVAAAPLRALSAAPAIQATASRVSATVQAEHEALEQALARVRSRMGKSYSPTHRGQKRAR